jgi:hypothetical protein
MHCVPINDLKPMPLPPCAPGAEVAAAAGVRDQAPFHSQVLPASRLADMAKLQAIAGQFIGVLTVRY